MIMFKFHVVYLFSGLTCLLAVTSLVLLDRFSFFLSFELTKRTSFCQFKEKSNLAILDLGVTG